MIFKNLGTSNKRKLTDASKLITISRTDVKGTKQELKKPPKAGSKISKKIAVRKSK